MKLKVIFATLLLCILISLTAVSAVDINQTEDFVAQDSDTVTQEILTDENDDSGDFKTLQNEIKTNVNNTFNLERNYIYDEVNDTEYSNGIVIDKDNFTIDGHGYTIDASNNARIFNITANDITLKNIKFINGNSTSGGAINSEGTFSIVNCEFINNTAQSGGAIYAYENLTVTDSQFKNNSAKSIGGAINGYILKVKNSLFNENNAKIGGAIYADTFNIINCNFTSNEANNGGAVCYKINGNISYSTFTSNYATEDGGAVCSPYTTDLIIISYSTFKNNTAEYGGALSIINSEITGSIFENNSADYGGAIEGWSHTLINSNFTNNSAVDGGAVMTYESLSVNNCKFEKNEAVQYGGVILLDMDTDSSISNSSFNENTAGKFGGALYCEKEILGCEINNCVFTKNKAEKNGGAIYYSEEASNCEINSCNFTRNTANENGGAIFVDESLENFTVENSNFIQNNAGIDGGAIEFTGNDLAIDNSIFANNTADLNSGAVYFKGNSLLIYNSEFESNKAAEFGGAVEVDEESNSIIIMNTKFNNNTAMNYAALGIYDGDVLIDNCTFDSNHAEDDVGAVYLNCPGSLIIDSYFINNAATDTMVAHAGGNLTVDNSQFIENIARTGTIIHNALNANLTVLNSIFDEGLYFGKTINNNYGNLYLHNNTLADSYAEIYSYGGTITSPVTAVILNNETKYKHLNENILIYFNIYDDNGNMIHVDGLDLFVNNTKTNYNYNEQKERYEANFTADKMGLYTVSISGASLTNLTYKKGEIVVMNVTDDFSTLQKLIDECTGTLTLTKDYTFNPLTDVNLDVGVEIMNNITIDGAGFTLNGNNLSSIFFVFSDNVSIKNITFINGTFDSGEGGAIYWPGDNGQLTDCNFINNHAEDGGAIYWHGNNGKISNCEFTDNRAIYGGALFFVDEDTHFNVTDCVFTKNTATKNGGAIFNKLSSTTVENSIFNENIAMSEGGAIYNDQESELIVKNSNFTANTANLNGGAISSRNNTSINNSIFKKNSARSFGGAVNSYNNTSIDNSIFEENNGYNGGALELGGTANTINNSLFTNNSANIAGAAILENTSIDNTNFTDNKAENSAGALFFNGNLKVSNSNFNNNSAGDGSNDITANINANVTLENVSPDNLTPLTWVILTAWVNDVKYGNTVEIDVEVKRQLDPINEGSVFVVINNKTYSAEVVNGNATIEIPNLDAGDYDDVRVTYNGSGKYTNSFEDVYFTVSKLNTTVTATAKTYVINYGGKYYVTLKDANGKLISGKTVRLTINGKTYKKSTNGKGVATFRLTKAILKSAGTKKVKVKFAGDKNYGSSTKTVKLTVKKEAVKILKAKKTYTFKKSKKAKNIKVTLKNSKNKVMKNIKVTIKLSGKKIKGKKTITAKTNKKGVVIFKLGKKLTQKTKIKYAIAYKGNSYYNKVIKKGKINIK